MPTSSRNDKRADVGIRPYRIDLEFALLFADKEFERLS